MSAYAFNKGANTVKSNGSILLACLLGIGVLNLILTSLFTIHPILSEESEIINAVLILGVFCVVALLKKLRAAYRYLVLFSYAIYDTVHLAMQNFWIERTLDNPEFEAVLGSEGLDIGSTPWFIYSVVFWLVAILLSLSIIKNK